MKCVRLRLFKHEMGKVEEIDNYIVKNDQQIKKSQFLARYSNCIVFHIPRQV